MSKENAPESAACAHRETMCLTDAKNGAGGICAAASWCRRVGAPGEEAESPVCVGRSPWGMTGRYYWLCRQCVIVYPGFKSEAAAQRMAHAHAVLRWSEHAVGRAVRAKRRAGQEGDLTEDELRSALRDG
ncbi:hypothetical protein [Streptomyces sp. NPDC001594]|uniref:hypothetical protein n=1 Tax=Streptomyces sp. NPDC001594 TaxID=3364590 RepID=UPI0036819CF3